jgi:hypothetical protein
MKQSIMIYKGSIFNGFNGSNYEVLVTERVDLTLNVDTFRQSLLDAGKIKFQSKFEVSDGLPCPVCNSEPDDLLLFRVATMIPDNDVILVNGTLTWLDDMSLLVYHYTSKKQHTTVVPPEAMAKFHALTAILNMMETDEFALARNDQDVDICTSYIVDQGYELYCLFVRLLHDYKEGA